MVEQNVPQSAQVSQRICPYWLEVDQSCSLFHDGLFLPGTEHVRLFCRHVNYSSCSHYLDSNRFNTPADAYRNQHDKRRSRRIPIRLTLHLITPACEKLEQHIDDTAQTVDISKAGLRFESRTAMKVGENIEFLLCHKSSNPPLQGTGRITWCHPLENAPLYHAGIVFADNSIAQVIQDQFELA